MENDKKILELQKVIEEKEAELKLLKKSPAWKTNASIVIFNTRYNLNVVKEEDCSLILSHLLMQKEYLEKANSVLCLSSPTTIHGFNYSDWEHDLILRVQILQIKEKESKLKNMKEILEARLSDEAKAKKDLQAVTDALKDL